MKEMIKNMSWYRIATILVIVYAVLCGIHMAMTSDNPVRDTSACVLGVSCLALTLLPSERD